MDILRRINNLSFFSGIFVIGGMSVYTVEFLLKRSKAPMATDFEWSYGAGWASAPFFFLAGEGGPPRASSHFTFERGGKTTTTLTANV